MLRVSNRLLVAILVIGAMLFLLQSDIFDWDEETIGQQPGQTATFEDKVGRSRELNGVSISRAAGSENSPPMAQRSSTSLDWGRLSSDVDLKAALESALVATNGEDAAVAIHLSALCVSAPGQAPGSAQEVAAKRRDLADVRATVAAVQLAHERIVELCRGVDWASYVDRIKSRNVQVGPLLRQMLKIGARQNSQEYFQAATQVLANPERYALAFDAWLERNISSVTGSTLSPEQLEFVQEELYRRFVPGYSMDSIRSIERCRSKYYCGSDVGLVESQRLQALAAADRIEQLVRQQRWNQLIQVG